MSKIIISLPDSADNKAVIAQLIGLPGVEIRSEEPACLPGDYLTLAEAADICGTNYFTFRHWVVKQQLIPSIRPSGKEQGQLKIKKTDLEAFMSGGFPARKKRKDRKEVSVL